MKGFKPLWVSIEVHKAAKKRAAEQEMTITEAIANALGENAKDTEKKVKSYGLFK